MSTLSTELRLSLATALLVTVLYVAIATYRGVPGASSLIGHALGIIGFLLMLGAEVLYTWRKENREGRWGRMRTWLQMHIYIGLIGPYLVLLHSSWRLNGLAGVVMLLTILMVASGFLCSYIYPALPRNVEGAELSLPEIEAQIEEANTKVQAWAAEHPAAVAMLGQQLATLTEAAPGGDAMTVLGRTFLRWRYQQQLRQELNRLHKAGVEGPGELGQLLSRRYTLETQIHSLAAARKLLGQSRSLHIVLGVVLFALAFVHIGVALYYATFAH
ncbi:MAG: hypothetical protein DPW09_01470 [Anaerolineae bacterium]|nr:hypothetical protein [Anaerolineae bacterium]